MFNKKNGVNKMQKQQIKRLEEINNLLSKNVDLKLINERSEIEFSLNTIYHFQMHHLRIPLTEEGADKGGGFLLLLKLWSLNSPLFLKRQYTE